MKKKLALVLVLALAALALPLAAEERATPPEEETPEAPATGAVKTGYAVISTAGKSADAGDADGLPKLTPPSWQLPWMMKVLSPTV